MYNLILKVIFFHFFLVKICIYTNQILKFMTFIYKYQCLCPCHAFVISWQICGWVALYQYSLWQFRIIPCKNIVTDIFQNPDCLVISKSLQWNDSSKSTTPFKMHTQNQVQRISFRQMQLGLAHTTVCDSS